MQAITNYIKHPSILFDSFVKNFGKGLSDETYLKLRYRFSLGKRLNLRTPTTFQEKLQWLKLHDRNPLYTTLVDKISVKDYVAHTIGNEYVIPLLGVWDKPEDIEWDKLPNSFVLKTNHSGGNTGVIICKDKSTFNKKEAIEKLKFSLSTDIYTAYREWPYKNIKKRVFAEEYLRSPHSINYLPDYKWYCFNGEPKFCQVIQDRTTLETIDFFDSNWQHQEFVGLNPVANNANTPPVRPQNLPIHIQIAKRLSKGIPFARVDLYQIEEKIFFGEITFYPASGMGQFRPEEWNRKMGELLVLPTLNK